MTWAKVDDRTHEDPRSEAAGVEAMGLWVLALSYMAAHSTDGRISLERCRRLAGAQKGKRLAERLVAAGWWELAPGDAFQLVGWERLLLPRAEVEERSSRAAAAGRKGGEVKASRAEDRAQESGKVEQRSDPRSGDSQPPTARSCSGSSDAKASELKDSGLATRAPDPDPTRPDPVSARARVRAGDHPKPEKVLPLFAGVPIEPDVTPPDPVDEVWLVYLAGRTAAGLKGSPPHLDEKRRKLIGARLSQLPLEDVRDAAAGIWLDPWHVERRKVEPEYVFRDTAHVEKFRDVKREGPADFVEDGFGDPSWPENQPGAIPPAKFPPPPPPPIERPPETEESLRRLAEIRAMPIEEIKRRTAQTMGLWGPEHAFGPDNV